MNKILIEPETSGIVKQLATLIEKSANEAIANDDIFKIGLSGEFSWLRLIP